MKKKIFDTRTIVFGAFLVTVALLLGGGFTRLTGIPLTIRLNFGGATQNIGFTAVPLIIASIVLGPLPGAAVAAIYDTLSYLLFTGGAWNPIFTLSEMAIGFIPGMIYSWFKKHPARHSLLPWIRIGLVTYTVLVIVFSSLSTNEVIQMISFQGGLHIVNGILLLAFVLFGIASLVLLEWFSRMKKDPGLFSYDKIYLVTFAGILARSLISGWGLWLYMGKNVPLLFYWLPRLVTPMFLVPVTAFMITSLGYLLNRYTKF